MRDKNKRSLIISLVLLMIVVLGTTYAFVAQVFSGKKQVVINSGVLSLILDEKNQVTISDAYPMYDEVGKIQEAFTFSLINKTSNDTEYELNLVDVTTGDKLSPSDVRYYLTKDDKEIGPDYLSSLSRGVVVGEEIQAQSLKYCKLMVTDKEVESLEDCVKASDISSIYELMVTLSTSTDMPGILATPLELGWALCNSGGFTTEEECLTAISSELPTAADSYEDIGNFIYLNFLGSIPDTSSVETSSSSYCELRLGVSTETECISLFNSTYQTSFSSYEDVTNYMLENGMIPGATISSGFVGGTIDRGIINGNTSIDYTLRMWIDSNVTEESQIAGKSLSYKLELKVSQIIAEASCPVVPKTIPNEPELASGMIAVTYNEEDKTWVKADTSNNDWYDYDNQMWANAVTVTEAARSNYMSMEAGEPISMDDINTMWVWIPRYSYTIMKPYGRTEQKCSDLGEITVESPSNCRKVKYSTQLRSEALAVCKTTFSELGLTINTEIECMQYYSMLFSKTDISFEKIIDEFISLGEVKDTRILEKTYPDNIVNSENNELPGAIDIKFISKQNKDTGIASSTKCIDNWLTPSGFTFGEEELSGIWVGKFETTGEITDVCISEECETANLTVKPNLTALRNQNVSSFFYASRSMQNSINANKYGFSVIGNGTMDTHLMKNTEWGVVAMLSQSEYGKYGNSLYMGADKEVAINNCSMNVTGIGGDFVSASSSDTSCTTNTYETSKGQAASTTGNITGIYDMSGGANEYVMGFKSYNDDDTGFCASTSISNCAPLPNAKYYDVYSSSAWPISVVYGISDATYETSRWYNDISESDPDFTWWILRGGVYNSGAGAGVFANYYGEGNGDPSSSWDWEHYVGFHIVLKP